MRQNAALCGNGLTLINDDFLDWSKSELADHKINVTQKLQYSFGNSRKHCGKRREC